MFNKVMFFSRYASYLTLCLRAALSLDVPGRMQGDFLYPDQLAKLLEINAVAGRSFFNVLLALGILEKEEKRLYLTDDANAMLTNEGSLTFAPYMCLGLEGDVSVQDFIAFLRTPNQGSGLYSVGAERSLMDEPNGVAKGIAYGLASRAKRFAPNLAQLIANRAPDAPSILELGAGSPFLARELRDRLPNSRITLADHANATRFITSLAHENGIAIQAEGANLKDGEIGLLNCNFFQRETLPAAFSTDIVVLSNVLHDWTLEQILKIIQNLRPCLKRNAVVVVHEAFLGGETITDRLWMSAYGMALNHLTRGQGSCYEVEEYDALFAREVMQRAGRPVETVDGCMALFYEWSAD